MADFTGFPKLDTPFVQADEKRPENGRIIAMPWYQLLGQIWKRTGGGSGIAPTMVQTGVIQEFAGTTAPDGYLMADGTAYLIADYPTLFAVIGYTFGGAGASFNVPDRRDRVAIGAGSTYPLGALGGAATQTLAQANLPNVSLPVTDPGHNHTQDPHRHFVAYAETGTNPATSGSAIATVRAAVTDADYNLRRATDTAFVADVGLSSPTTATNQANTTGVTVATGGSGTAFGILPPYIGMNFIIKT